MIKILYNSKEYFLKKDRTKYVLEKLCETKVSDNNILYLMRKFYLYDEFFLKEINNL